MDHLRQHRLRFGHQAFRLGHRGELVDAAGQFFLVTAVRQRPACGQEFLHRGHDMTAFSDPLGPRLRFPPA